MTQAEQRGFIMLIVMLLASALLLSFVTGGGRAFGNIFYSITGYIDERPLPSEETLALHEAFKQRVGSYWLIASVTTFTGLLTMAMIAVYLVLKRQILRAWCLLLAAIGSVMVIMALLSMQLQSAILALPVACAYCNSTRDGLAAAAGAEMLQYSGVLGAVFVLIGLGLIAGQIVRQKTGLE